MTIVAAKRLIFIGGAEGSGTQLLRRLLSAPDICASLGHNFAKLPDHPQARPLFGAFVSASGRLWDRKLSLSDHEQARRDWHAATEQSSLTGTDSRYCGELSRPDVDWLEGFFDARRRRQWSILVENSA